jgi:hypothetical protein
MAASKSRWDPRSSTLPIFAVSTAVAIAVGVLTYRPIPDVQGADRDVGTVEQAGVSPRCAEADRASVAELAAVLERHGPGATAIQERATHTLSIARRHCLYGWTERALGDYAWLRRRLSELG